MTTVVFTQEQLESLGYRLGELDDQFSPEERALIHGILARGVAGLREDAGEDVAGFAMLLPAVQKVREAASRISTSNQPGIGSLQVDMGDGSVVPVDQITLDFTKL